MRRVLASPYLALLLTAAIWGSLHPVGKLALRDVQPLQLILTRVIFAGLTVFILLALQGKAGELSRELRSRPGTMAVLGFLSFFGSSGASMSALALLPASVSSLLSNVSPLFVALGVIAIERRRTPPGVILGVVIGFAGLVVVVLGEDAPGVGSMALQPVGVGLALLGSLSWALYIGASRRAMAKGHPLAVVAASSLFGGLPWALLALADGAFLELFRLPPMVWALLLYTGIVGTGLTYGLWTAALQRLSAASVAVFQYAIPFFAVILAAVLLGERITMPLIVGGVGIIAGIAITQHAARSQSRRLGRDGASCRT